ncbi:DUF3800 domain-containing protein [Phyllobacterium meliloti]|uniref:DUF3800 domain-containing protein n=1 Tax=Phyllobacterium meliloti TaxID=555317 RepID=UPI001D1376E6|nr:DUF3800 domain-containing protein [Phyllobacterium sp. T1293]UGX86174.1 hypothetical protein LLE53_017380 [Phyllobacterium sp. T1293]
MGYFYFDESIHETAGFIVGAFVYSEIDLTPLVLDAIETAGLRPKLDEYKSSLPMSKNSQQRELRSRMAKLLQLHVRTALVVIPSAERARLGSAAIACLAKVLGANSLLDSQHKVYFDEGINLTRLERASFGNCIIKDQCDSKEVGGIQVADLAAHYLATMLKDEMTNDDDKKKSSLVKITAMQMEQR